MFQPRWRRGGRFLGLWVAASLVASLAVVGGGDGRPGVTRGQGLAVEPDLRWVAWDYDNYCFNGQPWPILQLVNRGPGAAGPFSVQDRSVSWRIAGLGPGEGVALTDWGRYPEFPVVIDPFDEVREQNEGNNVLAPSPNAPWTPTPRFSETLRDPSAPMHHLGRAQPDRPLTQPPPCPTRTPVPTLTPAGRPPLPDLVIVDARWWEETIIRDGAACRPEQGGLLYTVTVRNDGDADARYFEVGHGIRGALWRAGGLKRGADATLTARLRFLPGPLMVDSKDDIEESREDNNGWTPPFNGTPTPALTPGPTLPLCLPTLTPTPIPTEALPDLRLERVVWRLDGGRPLCLGPLYRLAISVRNAGRSPSGPFEVRAGGESMWGSATWFFDSLEPGELREDISGPLSWVRWPLVIDYQEQVPESDEADNLVWPDPSLTATPAGSSPPTCSPTPRATTPTPVTPSPTWPSVTPETPVSPSSVPPRARLVLPWARR